MMLCQVYESMWLMFCKVRDDMMSVYDAWDLKEQWFDLRSKYLLPVYEMKVNSVPYLKSLLYL